MPASRSNQRSSELYPDREGARAHQHPKIRVRIASGLHADRASQQVTRGATVPSAGSLAAMVSWKLDNGEVNLPRPLIMASFGPARATRVDYAAGVLLFPNRVTLALLAGFEATVSTAVVVLADVMRISC